MQTGTSKSARYFSSINSFIKSFSADFNVDANDEPLLNKLDSLVDSSYSKNSFSNYGLHLDKNLFVLNRTHETAWKDGITINNSIDPIFLEVLVGHLKASSGETNEQLRLTMVNDLINYIETMPADSNIIFGGDLNLYTSNEPAFQELIDANNDIVLVDPANRPGNWHNNQSFVDMFTQSTRTQSGLGGASGGFDDRFDFLLTSNNMITNSDIYYVNNSYLKKLNYFRKYGR